MLDDSKILEKIFTQVKQLSPEHRLRLVQRIIQTLITSSPSQKPEPIRFG